MMTRATNGAGSNRTGVFGSLSVNNSPTAATDRMIRAHRADQSPNEGPPSSDSAAIPIIVRKPVAAPMARALPRRTGSGMASFSGGA